MSCGAQSNSRVVMCFGFVAVCAVQRVLVRSFPDISLLSMRRAVARLVRTLSTSPPPMLYCSRTHAWVQRLRCGTAVRVGLTERGLDDIGDVEAVEHIAVVGKSVARASALPLQWLPQSTY